MATSGRCPFATWRPSPNFTPGHAGRTAVSLHIAQGSTASALSWLRNPASDVSSHFFVTLAGQILQLVSIWDTAWTNGLTPDGDDFLTPGGAPVTPTWPLITPGVNPNRTTITIEHEGVTGKVWPAAMQAATVKLLTWLRSAIGIVYEPLYTLIGHCHINPIDRPYCPGPTVDYGRLAALAMGQQLYQVDVRSGAILREKASVESRRLDALDYRRQVVGVEVPSAVAGERGLWVKMRRGHIRRDLLEVQLV